MKNSSASEKSKGVVIFANNTDTIDYVSIARRAEQLINHYLKLPVTILETTTSGKNVRYNIDTDQYEEWNNSNRYMAYELSPYDQTILLDSDYLVLDNNLLKVLDTTLDYKIARQNRYPNEVCPATMGAYSIETLWATIITFNKTPKTKMLFDLVGRIERHYGYYRRLYNITTSNFRNDYAFTIADNILNGYCQDSVNYIPWSMYSINDKIDSLELHNDKLYLKTQGQAVVLPKQSIHVMSKTFLTSDACLKLIKEATSA